MDQQDCFVVSLLKTIQILAALVPTRRVACSCPSCSRVPSSSISAFEPPSRVSVFEPPNRSLPCPYLTSPSRPVSQTSDSPWPPSFSVLTLQASIGQRSSTIVKEAALFKVKDGVVTLDFHNFFAALEPTSLTPKEKRTNLHLERYVHLLPYSMGSCTQQDFVEMLLRRLDPTETVYGKGSSHVNFLAETFDRTVEDLDVLGCPALPTLDPHPDFDMGNCPYHSRNETSYCALLTGSKLVRWILNKT